MEGSLLSTFYPIHPKLVHFPIALIFSAMGMQGLGLLLKKDFLCQAAWLMFVLAVISIPIVIFSGLLEANRLHVQHPILNAHKVYAFLVAGVSFIALIVLWLMRSKNNKFFQISFFISLLVIAMLTALTAHQGGRMVYEYGVGVSQ